MRHRIAVMTATAAISFGAIAAGPVAAEAPAGAVTATAAAPEHASAPMAKRGLRCVAAGVRTLIELGILRDAALQRVDYSVYADPVNGPIFTTLPAGSFLPLGDVIRLHITNPELFAWCR